MQKRTNIIYQAVIILSRLLHVCRFSLNLLIRKHK